MRHLNSIFDLSRDNIAEIFERTASLKHGLKQGHRPQILNGRVLTQVFEKPSLRTRVSFEAAFMQLGGSSTFLSGKEAGLEGREAIADVARVLGGYSDMIVLRTFSQRLIDDFVQYAGVPIINGLSDQRHPCQALTDLFTIQEIFGSLENRKLVYVGDGNNVATSLAALTSLLDVPFTVCAPKGYQLPEDSVTEVCQHAPRAQLFQTSDVRAALRDAAVVYTDVWTSMGQEAEDEERRTAFEPFQVNSSMMKLAPKDCRFMHCLPAKRGREVTDEIIDSPQSVVFQQAENRMHLAKGLITWLFDLRL